MALSMSGINITGKVSMKKAGGAFNPADLFTGQQGAWYDPSDLSSMFSDDGGTVPAVVNGYVGRINDKSGNNNHAKQSYEPHKPVLRLSGGKYYLEYNSSAMTTAAFSIGSLTGYSSAFSGQTDLVSVQNFFLDADAFPNRVSQLLNVYSGTGLISLPFNTFGTFFLASKSGVTANTNFVGSQITTDTGVNVPGSGSVVVRVNGTPGTPVAIDYTLSVLTIPLALGCYNDQSQRLIGRIYGALHINRPLTGPEMADLETYLAAQAGI